jgi:hypothetical protein
MALYKLRYFFDPGSGVCLWSANEPAKVKFAYPVEIDALKLPASIVRQAEALLARFDTSIDWHHPPGPSPWTDAVLRSFNADAQAFLVCLRYELGTDFDIIDESKTECEQIHD